MAAPGSIDELLKLIRKSGMIDDSKLEAYLKQLWESGGGSNDVKKIAGAMVKDGLLTYFQAEQFLLGKWRGFTIGKYKLLERIGFGGMGQVFLCEHMYMRRRVAIKVLPPAKAEEPAALGRFYREARAAAALDHPNIVRTHDIDQDGNLHFLVMEYVNGSSLLEIIKKTTVMDVLRATHYIWQAAQGLDHAYRVGVIHRDIKPGNILVDRFGISKILDMGLARFYHTDDDMLTLKYDEKSVLGTADYVAPEQTINSHDVDVRADIYSLGCTFYFLLAGYPPFPDGTIAQKLISHQTRSPTPIREIRPEVPEEVAFVLEKMMAKSLNDRYQTPSEIYEALLPWVQSVEATPPEEEMPLLSPAARETLASTSASMSGTFRQDSAILRAEIMQRSGKLSSSGVRALPPDQSGVGTKASSQGSSAIRPPFFDPLPSNPFNTPSNASQAATVDTRRMQSSERTTVEGQQPYTTPPNQGKPGLGKLLGTNAVLRIAVETVIVFLLVALGWAVLRGLGFFDGVGS